MNLKPSIPVILLVVIALLLLSGCVPPDVASPTPAWATVTVDPSGTVTRTPFQPVEILSTSTLPITPTEPATSQSSATPNIIVPSGTPAPQTDRTLYTLNVVMDYADHSLGVSETIVYSNHTGVPLNNIVMAVEPNRWQGVFQISSLSANDQPLLNYVLDGIRLDIPLAQILMPGETVVFDFDFSLALPQTAGDHIFGYNSFQVNLIDWYPFIVPYLSEQGWLLHDPFVTGEHLVYDPADFDVRLTLQDPSLLLSVAASAPAQLEGDGRVYQLQNARTFVLSASEYYQSVSAMVGNSNTTITSYYAARNENAGTAILQAAEQAITLYSELFAPYPYPSLSIVEGISPDGMEADGMIWLSRTFYDEYDGTLMNNLISIGVHEVAHQWWFALVGNDQALEPWLDEALCTYSEWIYYKHNYPNLANRWWYFRVGPFNPSGFIDISIYEGGSFRPYVNAVYLRGAYFMDALRVRVGDDAFFQFLKDYSVQLSNQRTSANVFFDILSRHTDADISDILTEYFR